MFRVLFHISVILILINLFSKNVVFHIYILSAKIIYLVSNQVSHLLLSWFCSLSRALTFYSKRYVANILMKIIN